MCTIVPFVGLLPTNLHLQMFIAMGHLSQDLWLLLYAPV
ncbi:hypothetical protein T11_15818 [Trichinella zimbabwensis]|uniref:Uncharacterized protein n=1 Tax=Trichinella zimbabwensis TaxID=268475 RepID=A0A0V1DSG6_9BILA|nr:hypothetical protein T11_15818 [Trichinella zimbabwensis]